jgi:hypothetical protein
VTKTRYDIFIPQLSRNKTYKTLPAVGAYLKELTAADLVQFASPIPESGTIDWLKTTELEDDILNRCNIRELLFPEEWDPAYVRKRQVIEVMSKEEHNEEEHEDEEPEKKGPLYDRQGTMRWGSKRERIVVKGQFHDGEILVRFLSTGNEAKVKPSMVKLEEATLNLLTKQGIGKTYRVDKHVEGFLETEDHVDWKSVQTRFLSTKLRK